MYEWKFKKVIKDQDSKMSFDSCIKPQRSKSPRDLFLQCYKETVYLTWRKANNK